MRTTVTLGSDTEQILRRRMRERNISFKEALNDAIRSGVGEQEDREAFTTETVSMGESREPRPCPSGGRGSGG